MPFFSRFASNTIAGSANQHVFPMQDEVCTGRVYYRVTEGGTFFWSLLFSNILDSTFADGTLSHCNLICPEWQIHEARIGRSVQPQPENAPLPVQLTFDGQPHKRVHPGEFFHSDPVELSFEKGEYFCLEMTFSGKMLPYHEESLLPIFRKTAQGWQADKRMPLPGMVGCDRKVQKRVAFVGDSITQGIGTPPNSYAHWNAVAVEKLPAEHAYWNLGIGYARANDLATGGAWMYKLRHNDVCVVCAGVNDLNRGRTAAEIKADLRKIVAQLHAAGCKAVVQTVPPFDYKAERITYWQEINRFILTELAQETEMVFDAAALLAADEEHPWNARYGGHPDEQGCRIWGEAIAQALNASGLLK